MTRWFYLHFRHTPPEGIVLFLESHGCSVDPVFETSFDVASPIGFSEFRHLLKTAYPDAECVIILPKNTRQLSSAE